MRLEAGDQSKSSNSERDKEKGVSIGSMKIRTNRVNCRHLDAITSGLYYLERTYGIYTIWKFGL